jgi:hypothetical protein
MNLFAASHQWSTRPPDERFASVEELHATAEQVRAQSQEHGGTLGDFQAMAQQGEILLRVGEAYLLRPTTWAFEQLTRRIGAPPEYLQHLPVPLVVRLLNHGLGESRDVAAMSLLLSQPEAGNPNQLALFDSPSAPSILRAVTGRAYARLWDDEITRALCTLEKQGWRVPPARPAFPDQSGTHPATEADVLRSGQFGLSIKLGDPIAPAGLYLGDRSLFAFLISEDRQIADGTPEGLSRGFFVWNSEVGYSTFGLSVFLFRHVCGNHIVWDVTGHEEIRLRHVERNAEHAVEVLTKFIARYADGSAREEEGRIAAAKRQVLGGNEKDVVTRIAKMQLPALTRTRAREAWEIAVMHTDTDGPPNTAWGFAQGLTRLSQTIPYANARTALDRSAGRILMLAG